MTAEGPSRLGVRSVTHEFSGVRALELVDFEVTAGSVSGLVGENGSGKSTLIKILTGALTPSAGDVLLDGQVVQISSPAEAQTLGIGVVHQDYHLFPELSVAANVYGVSKAPPRRRWGVVDKRQLERQVAALLAELGIAVEPDVSVRALGPAERKFVEIARAMLLGPRFLVLDEPTASLEPQGAHSVLALLERLRDQGVGLCFVSHRLDEVLRISSHITVLRDGRRVASRPCQGLGERDLAELIIGRSHVKAAREKGRAGDEVAVRARHLRVRPGAPPLSLDIRRGEVFGLTGLLGSGAAEIVRMLGGAEPLRGELEIEGRPVSIRDPRAASRAGIGFIPEDRKSVGLVQEQSMAVNISLPSLRRIASLGWVNRSAMDERAERFKQGLQIRARSVRAPVKTLSGGNQQKVMLAKWLASGVRILAIEEPTHGIDIGGKGQVHQLLRDLARDGGTVIVASTDVSEVLDLCDRIGVMRHGALLEVISSEELSHADLAAKGVKDTEELLASLVESGRETEVA